MGSRTEQDERLGRELRPGRSHDPARLPGTAAALITTRPRPDPPAGWNDSYHCAITYRLMIRARLPKVIYAIPLFVILTAGLYLYRSCLRGYFLADDFGYLQLYSNTGLSKFPSLFAADWSQGIWGSDLQELRPLTGLTYWIDVRIWGTNAFGYHLASLMFHTLAIAAVYLLVVEVFRALAKPALSEYAIHASAALGAFLFLVHPAHVEAVAWIAGR